MPTPSQVKIPPALLRRYQAECIVPTFPVDPERPRLPDAHPLYKPWFKCAASTPELGRKAHAEALLWLHDWQIPEPIHFDPGAKHNPSLDWFVTRNRAALGFFERLFAKHPTEIIPPHDPIQDWRPRVLSWLAYDIWLPLPIAFGCRPQHMRDLIKPLAPICNRAVHNKTAQLEFSGFNLQGTRQDVEEACDLLGVPHDLIKTMATSHPKSRDLCLAPTTSPPISQ